MESMIIWAITVAVIGLIVVPYYFKFKNQQKVNLERKKEAVLLGSDKPVAQYPLIDTNICIGCGSCAAACPEKEVLGVVFGKSTIINGLKCIGHGLCEKACPVEAIKVGLGDVKNRDDIPMMNEYNETNIKKLFIAGELGGFALIKNAIKQGKMVAEKISETSSRSNEKNVKDVIIIGAGPAGMSAGLTAIKNDLSYLIIDQQGAGGTILHYPRKKIVLTQPVEIPLYGYLNKSEYTKEELLDIWLSLKEKHNMNISEDEKLSGIIEGEEYFGVKTQNNEFRARNVILALGRRGTPRKLGVSGEDRSKVMYKLLDAASYSNEHIIVVGGGDSAVEAAIGLAQQPGNTVTLSYRKNKLFRIKRKNAERIKDYISSGKIKTLFNSNIANVEEKTVNIACEGKEVELRNDYIFVFAGGIPPFRLLKDMGIQFGGEAKDVN